MSTRYQQLNENFMFVLRRLVLEGDNLHRNWLVCVCWSWASVLYLRGHTPWEWPVVFQYQGKSPSLIKYSSVDVAHEALEAFHNVQMINTTKRCKEKQTLYMSVNTWEWVNLLKIIFLAQKT